MFFFSFQGMHACLVKVTLRIFNNSGNKKVNLPCLGEITVLSMGVLPFCLAFAIFWAANQHVSYAWVAKMFLSHPYLYWVVLNGWAWSTCTTVSCPLYFGYILNLPRMKMLN
ncbi:signal peptide peptidase-like 2 [Papaver somniferum]|uniref:signal peptide peptidase-like 2 n=1 Tax=Papaver somniferum TaxID=3469 RepID=UPI000E6FEA10|nr:signal peptide peptidase-like 2 [Papaver somniferum]